MLTYYVILNGQIRYHFTKTEVNSFSEMLSVILDIYKLDLSSCEVLYYEGTGENQVDVILDLMEFFEEQTLIYPDDIKFLDLYVKAKEKVCFHDKDDISGYVYSTEGDIIQVTGFKCTKCSLVQIDDSLNVSYKSY